MMNKEIKNKQYNINNLQYINIFKKEENNNLFLYNKNDNNKIYSIKNNKENIEINNKDKIMNKINLQNNTCRNEKKNNKIIKRTKTDSKTKYRKMNIIDLLEQPSLEMETFNKIVVGLKCVQKTQFKAKKDLYHIINNNEEINIENKKIKQIDNNISKNNVLSRSYHKHKKDININKNHQIENNKVVFPVNFIRPIDKSITINKKTKDRYQNAINYENIPVIIEEEILENNDEFENNVKDNEKKVNNNEIENNVKDNEKKGNAIKDIRKLIKVFNEFNSIKEIVYNLENYNTIINDLFQNINKEVENNILILNDILLSNLNLLLNNLSINYNTNKRNYIISFINNTKQIILYNTINNKINYYNFESIIDLDINFNNSMCIEYDDNDLIFLSGGKENTIYYSSDMILIISLSKEKIELNGKLPTRKSFHSNIYFEGKLYLLGGIDQNKKCSSNCFYFSVNNKKWFYLPDLNRKRANCSLCIQNKSILYVFRGRDDNNDLSSIEYLDLTDISNRKWNIFIPIDYGYVWTPLENSLIISYNNDKILICGGEDKNGNLFDETFLLDINNKNIYRGKDLLYKASFRFQGCYHKNEIFGIDQNNNFDKNNKIGIHYYNIKNNDWKFILT